MNPINSLTDILRFYQMQNQLGADPRFLNEQEQAVLGSSPAAADDLRRIASKRAQGLANNPNPAEEERLFGGFLSNLLLGNPVEALRSAPTASEQAATNRETVFGSVAPQPVQGARSSLLRALGGG